MEVQIIRTPGLGDSTYILAHEGLGLVVDPQRDIDRFEHAIDDAGIDLRFVLETHLHNDYISGGRDLARSTGAELVLPAAAAPAYRHRAAYHLEDIEAGVFTVRPIHTPGHTPEHTSYLILIEENQVAVFSGGSLLVGSAGRPDLLGPERADTLARLQFRSVHRLAELPGEVELFPTHGAGSFCTASGAGEHTSTIAAEKQSNPVFAFPDEDNFVAGQLAGLVPYPSYYRHMGPANVYGEDPLEVPDVPTLTAEAVADLDPEVWVVDARPKPDCAAGHLPGSIAVEMRDDFGVWAGWVLPFDAPIVVVMNEDQDLDEALRQLGRIGFDDIRGVVRKLPEMGLGQDSYRLVDTKEFASAVADGAQILDARAPDEWKLGTVDGSVLRYAPDVARAIPEDLDAEREVWVACETGYRASIAASFLQAKGLEPVVLADAGIVEVLETLAGRAAEAGVAG
jgi:glyoxylase-like metal-dependent hydrolase (beta-lactamase superfamily II)/rhodanese-related sulfurtransferase